MNPVKQIFAISLATLAVSSVMAQSQGQSYNDTAQVLSAQPIYERNNVPRQECANETVTTDRRVPSQGYVDAGYQPQPAPSGERTRCRHGARSHHRWRGGSSIWQLVRRT